MKKLFLEGKYDEKDFNLELDKKIFTSKIKNNKIYLFTTVQFIDIIPSIKKKLESFGYKVIDKNLGKGFYDNQVLGCSVIKTSSNLKAIDSDILYVGDGLFHPTMLKISSKASVFLYNPFVNTLEKIEDVSNIDISKIEKQKKASLTKFHTAQNIGIIVTLKPGQNKIKEAIKLKDKLESEDKNAYILLYDNIDFSSIENFNFLDVLVNTACPRLFYDDYDKFSKKIINISDLEMDD